MNSTIEAILLYTIGAGLLSIVYGYLTGKNILNSSAGNSRMQDIASAIQIGAKAYLARQYKTIAFVGFVIATVIHGFYDYFLLTSFMPGIWIMAFISLSIAVLFAQKAMTIHQDASPFKQPES